MNLNYIIAVSFILSSLWLLFWIIKNNRSETEYFTSPCNNCGDRKFKNCEDCRLCGWCVDVYGEGTCVPGDSNRPIFAKDCIQYIKSL